MESRTTASKPNRLLNTTCYSLPTSRSCPDTDGEAHFISLLLTVSFLNDLFEYDLLKLDWTELTGLVGGTSPVARYNHGFVGANGALYVFGGLDATGYLNPF